MTTDTSPACKCGSKLRAVIAFDAATAAVNRTCGRCKARWRVVIPPALVKLGDGTRAHAVKLTCLRPGATMPALQS